MNTELNLEDYRKLRNALKQLVAMDTAELEQGKKVFEALITLGHEDAKLALVGINALLETPEL